MRKDNRLRSIEVSFATETIKSLDEKSTMSDKVSDKNTEMSDKLSDKENLAYQRIVHYLGNHGTINNRQAQALLGKSSATVRWYLSKMVACDLLAASGINKARVYRLKR